MSWPEAVMTLVLAYFFTGMNMVAFHSQLGALHQPGYVRLGLGRRILAGAMWPMVGRANRELGWFAVTFASAIIVVGLEYRLVSRFVDSVFWRLVLVSLACVLPIVNAPLALVAMLLWLIVARPLGLRIPSGMDKLTAD